MRGCLTFVAGLVLGVALMALWWPNIPAGQSVPQGSDVRVRLSDGYLSRIVQRRTADMGLSGVSITSDPPASMIARGTLTVAIVSVPVSLRLQPFAEKGSLHVRLLEAQVGSVPL